jgi:hypothetical protein
MRKTINKDNDVLVYVDDDYVIYKKDGNATGTVEAPFALLDIAINGFESDENVMLFYKKDFEEIINGQIERLKKIVSDYPEDEDVKAVS